MSEDRARTSIIIPVWNGAAVLPACLRAVYDHSDPDLPEVVAVDNASSDGSADRIAQDFPAVRLIRQPFNLGFAGGVNAGMEAAAGDLFVLLNQDCMVEPGWLAALHAGFSSDPSAAIAGATIFDASGAVNHAGAVLEMPLAFSHHFTTITEQPRPVDYVTGALFAIRRTAWVDLGALDDEFYPAYFEEADYCYRARRRGLSVLYVPAARARHLQSSRAWREDPLLHAAQQHRSRYRFVAKHFTGPQLAAFFPAEQASLDAEAWFDQALGRALAARQTSRRLAAILARRQQELGESLSPAYRRLLQAGFAELSRHALGRAALLAQRDFSESLPRRVCRRLGFLPAPAPHQPPLAAQRAAQLKVLELLAAYDDR